MKCNKKILAMLLLSLLLLSLFSVSAFAATGDVAGAVENTWNDAKGQIKDQYYYRTNRDRIKYNSTS